MDIILYLPIYYSTSLPAELLADQLYLQIYPLKQWAYEDSHSPKYQKFKVDELPHIKTFIKQDWQFLLEYYLWRYGKPVKPVQRRNGRSIPEDIVCPLCGAPHHFIYDNTRRQGPISVQGLRADILLR